MTPRSSQEQTAGPAPGAGSSGTSLGEPAAPPQRLFDSVLCFGGEDWWYHNRGHFDMQLMRELSRTVPVLYMNSIGMRAPRPAEGRMFWRRLARKWRSIRRGLCRVDERFWVVSPFSVPGLHRAALSRWAMRRQLHSAMAALGSRSPLLWVACPPAVEALRGNPDGRGLVYQRTDRFENFPGVDREFIAACDRELKQRADLTLFCSPLLFEAEREECRASIFLDHGVDFERFAAAGRSPADPEDLQGIPRPRVGFIGGIDSHTFDPELLLEVVDLRPECSFVLVGACSLPDGWCPSPRVHLLGQRPHDQVAAYMAGCDVLIMPWNRSEWIEACNPIKLKEYLAVGRPVVSTPFAALAPYRSLVAEARTAQEFAAAIGRALTAPFDPQAARDRVREETWPAKAEQLLGSLARLGLEPLR
ncbi:MAG: glycosyltransferase [Planctomycetes bacterium]|nr:glycosyltransferase [Planctomycetota bacterium]